MLNNMIFHITNVCNYNCEHCQTFSDFKFRGHQYWKDSKDFAKQWAKKTNPTEWHILGGEPTVNPTWKEWVTGLMELMPMVPGSMSTNGSTLVYNKDSYEFFANLKSPFTLRIQSHNLDKKREIFENLKDWLVHPINISRYNDEYDLEVEKNTWLKDYQNIKDEKWPICNAFDDAVKLADDIIEECVNIFNLPNPKTLEDLHTGYKMIDSNNVTVTLQNSDIFGVGPLIPSTDRKSFKLHNSDYIKAHQVCLNSHCHNITNGKWYKCHVMAHLEEFSQQFQIEFDDPSDEELLRSYQPATLDMSPEELQIWIDNVKNPIPQCKFCPENMTFVKKFKATTNKINFVRKQT
jgi:organic radical activating enzyme